MSNLYNINNIKNIISNRSSSNNTTNITTPITSNISSTITTNIINNINILQYNTARSSLIQETLLDIGVKRKADILLIQEPRVFNRNSTIKHPAYITILPFKEDPRVVVYIRKTSFIRYNLRLDLIDNPDILILEINNPNIKPFYLINIYNKLNINKERTIERALLPLKLDKPTLLVGDFNSHHPL